MQPKPTITTLFALMLATSAAQAQATFSIGPRVGFQAVTAPYDDEIRLPFSDRSFKSGYRTGLEAGVMANFGFGRFAIQPSVLYSQKGNHLETRFTNSFPTGDQSFRDFDTQYRFNYLTLPLNVAYTQEPDGQGFQLFAGPYLAYLLNGRYTTDITESSTFSGLVYTSSAEGEVEGSGSEQLVDITGTSAQRLQYIRQVDYGFQAGLGYRRGPVLVQATYSQGLGDAGVELRFGGSSGALTPFARPTFRNRNFQVALAYLVGDK